MSTSQTTPGDPTDLPLLAAEAARLGLSLSPPTRDRFARYRELLLAWNDRAGLTAVTDPAEVERRHFGESLALLAVLRSAALLPAAATVVDLGTGGGFPGLPLALADPTLRVTLIEAQGRRCAFLRTVVDELALADVTVVQARAEEAGRDPALREHFDVAVARALAPLPVLLEYAVPLLRPGGLLACPKGSALPAEQAAAAGAAAALRVTLLEPLRLPLPPSAPPQHVALARRSGPLDDRYPRRPGVPTRRPLGA